MKKCHAKLPFIYIRDRNRKEPVNHENIYGCFAKMTEILDYKIDENTFSVEVILLREPECEKWFPLPLSIKDSFLEDMRSTSAENLKGKKLCAYISTDSGIIKAVQTDY